MTSASTKFSRDVSTSRASEEGADENPNEAQELGGRRRDRDSEAGLSEFRNPEGSYGLTTTVEDENAGAVSDQEGVAEGSPLGFEDMNLKDELLRGIYAYGFETPSAIQQRAIIPCVQGRDVIAQAQSGTGKTATFCTAVLERTECSTPETQAIILEPTRELALQTHRCLLALGDYMKVQTACIVGGGRVADDVTRLRQSPAHVVVGTPGRVKHLINAQHLDPRRVTMLVLDEADDLLSSDFKDQVYDIFRTLPDQVQVVLVSATMPPEVMSVTEQFMRNPLQILVKKEQLTLAGIRQFYVQVEREEWKFETLCDLYDSVCVNQAVIFCNSRRKVEQLTREMNDANFTVSAIVRTDLSRARGK
ncbi:hypothetical protein DPMN_173062 [Dreissena polymorpha]|uniref:RNA helicase n=1 Tax=Dreissena polymorpha TaxID=45954 RepID=A0A9D4E3Z2_DREPO|nr:hypothetical protein DPMN_173062 [Dreissena polymorpha]